MQSTQSMPDGRYKFFHPPSFFPHTFSDSVQRSELEQRDTQFHELTEKYTSETETRALTEQERDQLAEQLVGNWKYI